MSVTKRIYGNTFDYVIVFDKYPQCSHTGDSSQCFCQDDCSSCQCNYQNSQHDYFDSSILDEDRWISVKVNSALDQSKFSDLLKNYKTHSEYVNNEYVLYFNEHSHSKLPKIQPSSGIHEHVDVKIIVKGQSLRIRSTCSKYWYNVTGSVELDELPEQAAKREVHEELGIQLESVKFLKTKIFYMKIPIIDKPIKSMMYYYQVELDELPTLVVDKKEIAQVKLGSVMIY